MLSGYVDLVKKNRAFRNIWLGAIVSLTGDWFTTIALFSLLLQLTGKGEAVGLALVARFLPAAILGPATGMIADRFPRKHVMIACDLLRAVIVLGFLFVRTREDIPLAYLLTFLQLSLGAFFEPAEQAAIASVAEKDVVTANALHGITWSAVLALGAALGGAVTALVGRDAAFVIDSASYLGSALLISRADIPRLAKKTQLHLAAAYHEIAEGLRLLASDQKVRRILFAKAGWGISGGGIILLYSVFAERVFPVGEGAAGGLGVIYGARGLGALSGPLIARRFRGDSEAWLEQAIGIAFVLSAVAYFLFGIVPELWMASIAVAFGHMGVSTIWVFSNALINFSVKDEMRGRIFAADASLFTMLLTVSTVLTGHALDVWHVDPRVLMAGLALVLFFPAILWRATKRALVPAPAT